MKKMFLLILFLAQFSLAQNLKVSQLAALTNATLASNDLTMVVDTSAATSKSLTINEWDLRYISTALTSAKIIVGNGSNLAAAVTLSGDATISNAGVLTLGIVPLSKGGTNKNATASAGAIAFSDSDSLEFTGVGSTGQFLRSAGTGTPIWSSTLVSPTSSGDLTLSGGGVVFPATQVSSAGANTLDDYEEGTFTPSIRGTSTAGSGTYTTQVGSYTKIGNTVFIRAYVAWTNLTSATGSLAVGDLPFTSLNLSNHYQAMAVSDVNNITLSALSMLTAYVEVNTTYIPFTQYAAGGGAAGGVAVDTSGSIMVSGGYITD